MNRRYCNWSELPEDLLGEIAKQVLSSSVDDFTAFKNVCTSWRSAATKEVVVATFSKPWPSIPYIMLPEKEGIDDREFYSLTDNKVFMRTPLPEARGKICIEARFGWLLTVADSGEVKLLNPISRSQIDLPSTKNLPHYLGYQGDDYNYLTDLDSAGARLNYMRRAVLSENPSRSSEFVLAAISMSYLVLWKNGDEDWTAVELPETDSTKCRDRPVDVNYNVRDNNFYFISHHGYIYALDRVAAPEKILKVDPLRRISTRLKLMDVYIAESFAGGLLLITRNGQHHRFSKNAYTYGTTEFKVFRVDAEKKCYEETLTLEDEAIFVGHNAAFSVPAASGGVVRPNSVYFSDDSVSAYIHPLFLCKNCGIRRCNRSKECERNRFEFKQTLARCWAGAEYTGNAGLDATNGGGKNMGIYNLEDGSIERFDPSVERLSFTCPPLWISLSSVFA